MKDRILTTRITSEEHFGPEQLLCEQALEFNGKMLAGAGSSRLRFVPDSTKGYVKFSLAYAYPVVSTYASAFHAETVANCHESMLHQVLDYKHLVAQYYKGRKEDEVEVREDRILGSIVALRYPDRPSGGWKLKTREETPCIEGVAVIHKQAKGVDRMLGQHQAGRHEWTVSLELDYRLSQSGVLICPLEKKDKIPEKTMEALKGWTPADFAQQEIWYAPLTEAPAEILECWSEDDGMFTKPWRGHRLVTLLGGMNGTIHFKGVGLVDYGAEPTASVDQLLAEDRAKEFYAGMRRIGEEISKFNSKIKQ